jgi:hypothetical protein
MIGFNRGGAKDAESKKARIEKWRKNANTITEITTIITKRITNTRISTIIPTATHTIPIMGTNTVIPTSAGTAMANIIRPVFTIRRTRRNLTVIRRWRGSAAP